VVREFFHCDGAVLLFVMSLCGKNSMVLVFGEENLHCHISVDSR
jgi:hypothetical protein